MYLLDIERPAADQPGAPGVLRRDATGQHARRGQPPRGPRRAAGDRGDRAPADDRPTASAIAAAVARGRRVPRRSSPKRWRGSRRARAQAVITLCADEALARARAGVRGRLAGVPLLVKDLIDTAGVRTTYASAIYPITCRRAARRPSPRSRPRARSWSARPTPTSSPGACAARTSTTAIPSTRSRPIGSPAARAAATRPRSPRAWCRSRSAPTPAGRCACRPRACGVVGLKPALGAIPVEGVFPLVPSFDTVGPMARTVADCALAYAALTGGEVPGPRVAGLRVGRVDRSAGPGAGGGDEPGAATARLAAADAPARAGRARPRGPPARAGGRYLGGVLRRGGPRRTRRRSRAAATSTAPTSGPSSITRSR